MIRITGRTFDHRETLKAAGARWSPDDQAWTLPSASPATLAKLRGLMGVTVTDDAPTPVAPRSIDFSTLPRRRDTPHMPTVKYGDDDQWFNAFSDVDPRAFFGFSSLSALCKYVENIPHALRENDGWKVGRALWAGAASMEAALQIARDGWPKGLEMAAEIADILAVEHAKQRRRVHAIAGGSVNVGRMFAGNPAHMRSRPKQPGRKVVTFFVETFMSADISTNNAIARAALVAVMCDMMEQSGYSCEIVAVCIADDDGPAYQITVALKQAGEKLNLDDLIFALGHPAFFRRLLFGVIGSSIECRRTWESMGMPAKNALDGSRSNMFYVRKLTMETQKLIDDDDLRSRAYSMLPLIIPENMRLTNRE